MYDTKHTDLQSSSLQQRKRLEILSQTSVREATSTYRSSSPLWTCVQGCGVGVYVWFAHSIHIKAKGNQQQVVLFTPGKLQIQVIRFDGKHLQPRSHAAYSSAVFLNTKHSQWRLSYENSFRRINTMSQHYMKISLQMPSLSWRSISK